MGALRWDGEGAPGARVWFMQYGGRRLRRVGLAAGAVVLLLYALTWPPLHSLAGNLAARYDLARGRYQELGFGLPTASRPEYARLLRERYRLRFRAVAGCVVNEPLLAYVHAYNSVSMAATKRKFGGDVFEECARDAERNWQQRLDDLYGAAATP
jgi:hypothetical protein